MRPKNVVFHDQLPRHMSVFICPHFAGLSSQQSLDWLQPHSFFQLLTLVLGCSSPPTDHLGLIQKHHFHVLRADHSHVHLYLLLKDQRVPLRPLHAQVTGFAHNRSCRSSNLSPCLHFEDLFPPCLMLFCSPSVQAHTFRQQSVATEESFSSTSKLCTESATDASLHAAAAIFHNLSLSGG